MTDNETTAQRIALEWLDPYRSGNGDSLTDELIDKLAAIVQRHLDAAEQAEPKPPTCPFCGYDDPPACTLSAGSHRAYCAQCHVSLSGWCATRDEALSLHAERGAKWVHAAAMETFADALQESLGSAQRQHVAAMDPGANGIDRAAIEHLDREDDCESAPLDRPQPRPSTPPAEEHRASLEQSLDDDALRCGVDVRGLSGAAVSHTLADRIIELNDLMETAWAVIANATDWDSGKAREHWVSAAERWRDGYHNLLPRVAPHADVIEPPPSPPPSEAVLRQVLEPVLQWYEPGDTRPLDSILADLVHDAVDDRRKVHKLRVAEMKGVANAPPAEEWEPPPQWRRVKAAAGECPSKWAPDGRFIGVDEIRTVETLLRAGHAATQEVAKLRAEVAELELILGPDRGPGLRGEGEQ